MGAKASDKKRRALSLQERDAIVRFLPDQAQPTISSGLKK
ncbi:hypothetical protein HNQ99_002200 [Rhizorhapis suberifaciens]|uniref:Uncharacterized protein n=1 Tax=Rhizorhapis suberifaciens TaxID=13656 RepID=A0A840HUF4_9SPHN|nr:hypothetical protein [Rhizorhapis suberifaciens]